MKMLIDVHAKGPGNAPYRSTSWMTVDFGSLEHRSLSIQKVA